MKKKPKARQISNRRARFDYALGDSLVTGLELHGNEVRSLRLGHGQLRGAYVTVKDGELWLINAMIASSPGNTIAENEQTRNRKVLAKRREIKALVEAKQQGQTIVPLEILTGGRFIKLRLAVGRGKRTYDKRETIKRREADRRAQRAVSI
jgi:SsrA-binding protein